MAGIERKAEVVWEGTLAAGSGEASGVSSGAFGPLPVTWAARTEEAEGKTSPEELVAAAHAACYAMAFAHVLAEAGSPADRLSVSAVVGAELGDDGLRITSSELTVTGRVPGLDAADFSRHAQDAERGCPVSNALRGNIEIRVDARLED